MTNIIYPRQFHSRVTASTNINYTPRPYAISARRKRDTLLNSGWNVYDGETIVVYTNPEVSNNEPFFLDDAYGLQMEIVHGRRNWK